MPSSTPRQRLNIASPNKQLQASHIPRSRNAREPAVESESDNGSTDYGMSADDQEPPQMNRYGSSVPLSVAEYISSPKILASHQAGHASRAHVMEDTDMDALASALADTSLGFIPRGVRKKQKEIGRAGLAGAIGGRGDSEGMKQG
ncbi:hypothetical protein QFC19_006464 [Naganishia cerealis]|uniref:Uncharacterized protein n=1 Tax=Naganishia cerealis TaxID=610337 RepID=A0ACC2VHE9_9TREE|nr:hypothetical protein QFC19_006464 [Naganishia cerealis]